MDGEIMDGVCLAGPIVAKQIAQQIITGPVLIPGEKDSDGESVSEEKIENVAMKFMEIYGNVDVAHSFNNVAIPVESWILRSAMKFNSVDGDSLELPRGTWMLSSKIRDDKTWQGIVDGKLNGYSIAAISSASIESAQKDKDTTFEDFMEVSLKRRTLLKDLNDDWVAAFVSIVGTPAVWKSKWVAMKSVDENPLQRFFNRFKNKSNEKTKEDNEMDEKKLIAAMKEAAVEAVTEVVDEKVLPRLEAVETKMDDEKKADEKPADEKPADEKPADEKPADEKPAEGSLDLSKQIGEVQGELLDELQADAPDLNKIKSLQAKLETLKELQGEGKKEDEPETVEALKSKMADMQKQLDKVTKGTTESRAGKGQSGGVDVSEKSEEVPFPRDASGCRVKKIG
jgi:hypothetical protein